MIQGCKNARFLWASMFVVLLVLLALLTGGVLATHSLLAAADLWFEQLMLGIRTPFFLHFFAWLTLTGNTSIVIAITGATGMYLYVSPRGRSYALGLAASVVGAGATSYLMKILVARTRPSGLIPTITETSFSFPSGHATFAVALYGFIAFLLCRRYPRRAAPIVTLATLFALALGFSRLYLGVHFPTDVLAGFLLGSLWLFVGIEIFSLLKRNDIVR